MVKNKRGKITRKKTQGSGDLSFAEIAKLLGVLVVLIGVGLSAKRAYDYFDEKKMAAAAPPIEVSARTIYNEYIANEIAADAKYNGKRVRITGIVGKLAKGFAGDPYVILSPSGGRDGALADAISSVQVSLGPIGARSAEAMKAGQKVTFDGVCEGMTMASVMIQSD